MRRLRTLAIVGLTGTLVGVMGTVIYLERESPRERELKRLKEVITRLETEHRVAEVVVTRQASDPATRRVSTSFRFCEIDRQGRPLASRDYTIDGEVAYFDALVVKFEHSYVEMGDALRGRSLYLFRRVFGEYQEPSKGFPLDEPNPAPYRLREQPSEFERDIWAQFWKYATDPNLAASKGVRVAQGEAVYTKLLPGKLYRLTLETSSGLNLRVENLPEVLQSR